MIDLFQTATRSGVRAYFVASSLDDARRRAAEIAGRSYRYIALIKPGHPLEREARKALGL